MTIEQWFVGPQLVGMVIFIAGFVQKTYPPKKINSYYGYRSPTSQKNQQTWDEGNQYSGKLMMKMGIIAILIGVVVAPFADKAHQIIIILLMLVAGISIPATMIALTEKHLNKLFDKKDE